VRTRADANRRHLYAFGNHLSDFARHQLKHNGKHTSVFQRVSIIKQLARRAGGLALNPISTQLINRLWRQTNVPHHRDLFVHQTADELDSLLSAFEFDRFRLAFFHQSQSRAYRVVCAGVKRSVWHVGDQQRPLHAAAHRFHVHQDLLERHRYRVAITEHYIPEAIANQDDVNARLVNDSSRGVIVGSQTNQPLTAFLACP
jgi:hypothetical protein